MDNIKNKIQNKINEHKKELEQANLELEFLQKKIKSLQREKSVLEFSKVLVLRERAIFHRAGILVLEDLLKEV